MIPIIIKCGHIFKQSGECGSFRPHTAKHSTSMNFHSFLFLCWKNIPVHWFCLSLSATEIVVLLPSYPRYLLYSNILTQLTWCSSKVKTPRCHSEILTIYCVGTHAPLESKCQEKHDRDFDFQSSYHIVEFFAKKSCFVHQMEKYVGSYGTQMYWFLSRYHFPNSNQDFQ